MNWLCHLCTKSSAFLRPSVRLGAEYSTGGHSLITGACFPDVSLVGAKNNGFKLQKMAGDDACGGKLTRDKNMVK
jgi:hypothetical protein